MLQAPELDGNVYKERWFKHRVSKIVQSTMAYQEYMDVSMGRGFPRHSLLHWENCADVIGGTPCSYWRGSEM